MFHRVNLRTQKRLAASVVGCGKRKIWLDPNETSEIANANSRQTVRKLVQDGLIIRKPVTMHSRARAQLSLTLLLDTLLPPLPRRLGLRTLGVHLFLDSPLAGLLSLGLVDLWCMLVAEL